MSRKKNPTFSFSAASDWVSVKMRGRAQVQEVQEVQEIRDVQEMQQEEGDDDERRKMR